MVATLAEVQFFMSKYGYCEEFFDSWPEAGQWIQKIMTALGPEKLYIGIAKINNRLRVRIGWRT